MYIKSMYLQEIAVKSGGDGVDSELEASGDVRDGRLEASDSLYEPPKPARPRPRRATGAPGGLYVNL